ncbi:FAD-dependent oxidoreductase [Prosthecomicrobium sp. N25]|uniref:FAD-dependent oxidoreductase n=1 Tax=Prosthecomicrobium sp. N25 TaxID=3129254 RepID=UPI003077CED8
MPVDRNIVVVGAGIGGLAAALSLARAGVGVTVLERAPQLAEVGAGLQISPNASRILVGLGLQTALDAVAVTPEALVVHSTRAGGALAEIPLGPAVARRFGAPYWVIHRADLQAALVDAVRANPAIALHLDTRVDRMTAEPGSVRVEASVAGEARRFVTDGVVGADGVWSMVRTGTLGGPPARYSGRMALRATIPIDETPPEWHRKSGIWMAPRAHLVHYPVRSGRELNLVAIVEGAWEDESWSVPIERDDVVAMFDPVSGTRWPEAARALILSPRTWTRWALAGVDPRFDWSGGPVTLLGDAAHAMLPFAAQGAAMAIEDAAILAGEVARPGIAVADAFAAYERLRKGRVSAVREFAETNGRIYHLGDALAFLRDAGLRLASGAQLLERQAWIYGWSPEGTRPL